MTLSRAMSFAAALPLFCALLFAFGDAPAAPPRHPVVHGVVTWRHGDTVRRLIPEQAGFCYLSGIGGNLEGGGEAVRIYVDDGFWWVAGRSCQPSLWAEVTCIRW